MSLVKDMDGLSKIYTIPDYVTDSTEFIFLLESPHVEELKSGMPVSGGSGISMTKVLLDGRHDTALGKLLKQNKKNNLGDAQLDKIGLMNVCAIPMQQAAYQNQHVTGQYGLFAEAKYKPLMFALDKLRKSSAKSLKDPDMVQIQQVILRGLQHRLQLLQGKEVTIIPCGNFARQYLSLAGVTDPLWTVFNDIPHPSFNNWNKKKYKSIVSNLKKSFNT